MINSVYMPSLEFHLRMGDWMETREESMFVRVNDSVRAACSCKWAVRAKECVVVPRSSDDENVAMIDELIPVSESDEERVKVVKIGRTMEGGENRRETRHIPQA
jgi:hypothetical protein